MGNADIVPPLPGCSNNSIAVPSHSLPSNVYPAMKCLPCLLPSLSFPRPVSVD
jgi:hypothetical protein